MRALRTLVLAGLPVALLLVANVDLEVLAAHPGPPAMFGLFWVTLIFLPPYLERARWFDRDTYGNLLRLGTPLMAAVGAVGALAGAAAISWSPDTLGPAAESNTFLGLGLLWWLATIGAPIATARNTGVVGGAIGLGDAARPDIGDVVERALELEKGTSSALPLDQRAEVASAVGVSLDSMDRAARELSEPGVIRSHPPPVTRLAGNPPAGEDGQVRPRR